MAVEGIGNQRIASAQRLLRRWAMIETLESRCLLDADPLISEFMASNGHKLTDIDGAYSDWIEIRNPNPTSFNLSGWHLTDNSTAAGRTKWTFPTTTTLAPNGYLVVFASDKNRAVAGQQLHTNFKLDADGEYLALTRPDGTVAFEYPDPYPAQQEDVSYGIPSGGLLTAPVYFTTPTPGAANQAAGLNNGPFIAAVSPPPATSPADGDNIVVTATVAVSSAPILSVALRYRVQQGAEFVLTMFDDGAHADGAAGDGVYAATIPASASTINQMVRWYVTATDTGGRTSRAPLPAIADSPQYFGTVIRDPALNSPLPIIQLFAQDTANLTTRTGARAAVFYNGQLYDNVFVRDRGGFGSDGIKIDFNKSDRFLWDPNAERVDEINLNYRSGDPTTLRAPLSFAAFADSGHPTLSSAPWRMQLNGTFWKAGVFIENVDAQFLDRVGLDGDGALYKAASDHATMTNAGNYEKKTRENESNADLQAFLNGIHLADATARKNYILDNFDLMGWLNYWAVNQIVEDQDDVQKNFYLYRDTQGDGRWRFIVWDKDLTFGKNFNIADYQAKDPQAHPFFGDQNHPKVDGPNAYNYLFNQLLLIPEIKQMYRRRLRSVMDQLLQPDSTPLADRFFESRIDQLYAQVSADPQVVGYLGGAAAFQTAVNDIKTKYLPGRRTHLYVDHSTNTAYPDFAGIPAAQVANPSITISAIDFNPTSGTQAQEYIKLTNANAFAVDISGWKLADAVDYTFAGGTVIPANGSLYVAANIAAFRTRTTGPSGNQGLYVVGDYDGQLSARGETILLQDAAGATVHSLTYTGAATAAQQALRVTEIMYHPANAPGNVPVDDDFEYIEVQNVSGQTLNLAGIKFTKGADVALGGAGYPTTLAPGAYGVVVRNVAAFQSRYGTGVATILGEYTPDVLDNGGERIRLEDGVGEVILDFSYAADWQPTTDGGGKSLVLQVDPATADIGTWGDAATWRASTLVNGSPGAIDPTVTAPKVQSVKINDGTSAQRSMITSLTVTFDQAVVPGASAFTLTGRNGAGAGTTLSWSSPVANPLGAASYWIITFAGSSVIGGSLADGIYDLAVVASQIHAGTSTGPAMAADYHAAPFHRLYSDSDGDGDSDALDLFAFRGSYNKPANDPAFKSYFDYDNDGDADNADLIQVRNRRAVEFKGY